MTHVNVYAGSNLDRMANLRTDEAWLTARRGDPETRYVALWRGLCLVEGDEAPNPVLLPAGVIREAMPAGAPVVLLGLADAAARFAVDLSDHADDPGAGPLAGRGAFRDLRDVGRLMSAPDAALLAHARGVMNWHRRHRFCGVCGAATELREAGYLRVCADAACAAQHFPRTDPAIIVLVSDGERCLLGRGPDWPQGLYSTLAGFVEPGESLEEAVAREIKEEAGIDVRDVRYHSSQPWPFPASLMLGFHAVAATTALIVDRDELDDARWFHRDELLNPSAGARLPRVDSIARQLVEHWLGNGDR